MPILKEFTVGELFDLRNPKGKLTTRQLIDGNDISYVAAKKTENGIAKRCSRENIPDNEIMPGNCIVFVQQGDGSAGYTTYQPNDFYAISCICCGYNEHLNEQVGMYLVANLDKNKALFNHSNSWSGDKLKNTTILLPSTPSGDPDWDYMESYIRELERERISELERERISELEQYLIVTGLNDYELTEDDKKVLSAVLNNGGQSQNSVSGSGWLKEVREFRVGDLFESANGDIDLKKEDITGRGEDLVSSGLTNNGIIGKTDKTATVFNGDSITVDMFGYAFYRDEPYKMVTHARVFALLPKFEMNSYIGRYFVGSMKHFPSMFSYNNMCSWNKIKDDTLLLPSTPFGDPDWNFISTYIKAIEKVVIRDVVDWKDKEIATTRKVVNSEG